MRAHLVISVVLVSCSHAPPSTIRQVPKVATAATTCLPGGPIEALGYAPAGISLLERTDIESPGYARLLRITTAEGRTAEVAIIRFGSPTGRDPLFRGERREWALSARFEDNLTPVVAYSYLNEQKPTDIWLVRDGQVQRVRGAKPGAEPTLWACDVLAIADLSGMRVRQSSDGTVVSRGKVVRLFRPDAWTKRHLTKGR